mmetsp:Transcript_37727/g.94678  ORF Transcript_37727/g.94678 Transcript_37727/m.94678 type:complete len:500 (+) Transcript_37727:71-1570(+)
MLRHLKVASLAAVTSMRTAAGHDKSCAESNPSCGAPAVGHNQLLLLQLGPAGLSKEVAMLGEATEVECHTAVEEEECYEHVLWAKQTGIWFRPDWYTGLTPQSSFEEFQAVLHQNEHHPDCPMPCLSTTTAPPSSTTSAPTQASAIPTPIPVDPELRYATVSHNTARIPVGGEIRFYVVGTSNAVWQTWPDQVHVFLRELGYVVPSSNYELADSTQPMSRAPVCDNAHEYQDLESPRIGRVGWASWGFAYDSKDDCVAADYEGAIGEHGFREIAGHQVSCVNSWACNPSGQRDDTLVSPTAVARDARDADVVFLSNWINDSKQRWSQFRCFKGEEIDFVDTTDITVQNLKRIIQAIHNESPTTVVLIMALYPDSAGPHVMEHTLSRVAAINEQVRTRINEPNTHFVDYTFPTGQEVFSSRNPGHANCRGDMVMATKALEVLFDEGVLARGLALPTGDAAAACLANTECAAIADKACCQLAASCHVGVSGLCESFGPGMQ